MHHNIPSVYALWDWAYIKELQNLVYAIVQHNILDLSVVSANNKHDFQVQITYI